jgi:hypothetical protein
MAATNHSTPSQAPPGATDAVLKPSEAVPDDATQVEGIDFNKYANRSITIDELVSGMSNMGFQATSVGEAVRIIDDMVSGSVSQHRRTDAEWSDRCLLLDFEFPRACLSPVKFLASIHSSAPFCMCPLVSANVMLAHMEMSRDRPRNHRISWIHVKSHLVWPARNVTLSSPAQARLGNCHDSRRRRRRSDQMSRPDVPGFLLYTRCRVTRKRHEQNRQSCGPE